MSNVPPEGHSNSAAGLHYEVFGSGDPILAIHGLGASNYTWRKLKGRLPDHRLILIDLKGHGESVKPRDTNYSIPDQAELVLQFIREHDLRNLTVVGNSYGGAVSLMVAIRLCQEEPERLSKLILICSGGYNQDLPWHLKLIRTPVLGGLALHLLPATINTLTVLRYSYYQKRLISWEQCKAYARPIGSPGGRHALIQVAKQAVPENFEELIAQYPTISVPTLLIWGRNDRVIPLSIGERLNRDIPDSKLVVLDHVGHVPQEESPEETIAAILTFLEDPSNVR
ncbi:MAG TPA: alpha/beta hydrolase [Pyrinomonadaceae bacterium]|nr:alpha/beta hydrolase [Pyrinomonadaceae bacterium]